MCQMEKKKNQENKKNVKKTCGKGGKWGEVSHTFDAFGGGESNGEKINKIKMK